MKIVGITALRAGCHRILAPVRRTGRPVPVARRRRPRWLGSLQDRGDINADIVSPATSETDRNVLKT